MHQIPQAIGDPTSRRFKVLSGCCKRRRETVALVGAWQAVEWCSAHMFSCRLRDSLEVRHYGGFPVEKTGGDK